MQRKADKKWFFYWDIFTMVHCGTSLTKCLSRDFRLHIVISDSISNAMRRLFSSFSVRKRGLDCMSSRFIASPRYQICWQQKDISKRLPSTICSRFTCCFIIVSDLQCVSKKSILFGRLILTGQ